jgi:hypothetical protein
LDIVFLPEANFYVVLFVLSYFYHITLTCNTCTTFTKKKIKFFELPLCLVILTVSLSAKAGHLGLIQPELRHTIYHTRGEQAIYYATLDTQSATLEVNKLFIMPIIMGCKFTSVVISTDCIEYENVTTIC